jgi:hypothetical protein
MTRVRVGIVAFACAALLAACGSTTSPAGSPGPRLSPTQLKLLIIDHLGSDFRYCDPDSFPVARGTPLSNARSHRAAMERDRAYPVILAHLGIAPNATLSNVQLLEVYERYKKLAFVDLRRSDGEYDFVVRLATGIVTGTISDSGAISESATSPKGLSNSYGCPICLARNTRIATPGGFVRVQDVRVGMAVWSTDHSGHRIRSVVVRVGRTPVPPTHEVVRLVLADGRTVFVSPGHPTPDGTAVGDLRVGEALDGSTVASTRRIPYSSGFTYDLLPSGPTGTYFANGVLLGSTLAGRQSRRTLPV